MTTFNNSSLTIEDLPQVVQIQFKSLHPFYRWTVVISHLVWLLLPTITMLIIVTQFEPSLVTWLSGTIVALLLTLYLTLQFFRARNRHYAIRNHDILFKQGLWWKKVTAVAFNRIQHIDLSHDPLQRKYQMATLKFFTAGGSAVDLKIPGLPEADAKRIRAFILELASQHD